MCKQKPLLSLAALAAALGLSAFAPADLTTQGWTHIADTADASVFMKASDEKAGELRKAWTAYELDEPRERDGFSFRSVKSLAEFDCAKGRSRVTGETFHAGEGLSGKEWSMPGFVPTEWAEPAEGSIGSMRLEFACPAPATAKS